MKLTLTNIKKMKANSTPLQKRVIDYIVDEWSEYDDKNRRRTNELSSTSDRRQKLSNRSYGRQTVYTRRRSAAVTTVFLNNNLLQS